MKTQTVTTISYENAMQARILYSNLRALDDLLLTIPHYPEKAHLLSEIENDKEHVRIKISEWWEMIAEITGKTFSEDAEVKFDMSIIID